MLWDCLDFILRYAWEDITRKKAWREMKKKAKWGVCGGVAIATALFCFRNLFETFHEISESQTADASRVSFSCLVELWVASENFTLMKNKSFGPLSASFLFTSIPLPPMRLPSTAQNLYFLSLRYPEALNCSRKIKDILLCDAGINCFLFYSPASNGINPESLQNEAEKEHEEERCFQEMRSYYLREI